MNKGVSLISLIVTIIVIIILASIAMFSATGSIEQSYDVKKQAEFEDVCTFVISVSSRAEAGLLDLNLTDATVATVSQLNSVYSPSGELTAEEQNKIASVNESSKKSKYKYHYITGSQLENASIPGLEDLIDDKNITFPKQASNDYIINFQNGVVISKIAANKTLVHGKILGGG